MAIPSEMKALLLVGDGYTRTPSGFALEAMEPISSQARLRCRRPDRRRC